MDKYEKNGFIFNSYDGYLDAHKRAKETAKNLGVFTADAFKMQNSEPWNVYEVGQGETGASIAKRYNITEKDLALINGWDSASGNKIQAGTIIKLPEPGKNMGQGTVNISPSWNTQLDDTINKVLNREEFNFNLNGDALYNQYKDSAIRQGKLAMEDAIGKASAMTGGYGNSFAQSVGQQQYNAEFNELNNIIPEIYNLAHSKYNDEGQDLLEDFSRILSERDTYLNDIAAENTENGIDDDTKWMMDYALNALKNGYTVDFNTGAFTPVEYNGLFAQKTLTEDAQYIIDVLNGKKSYKSINYDALPTVGSRRAYFLLDWYKQGAISPEDMDYLAERYSISEEDMDKAMDVYNKKA